MQTEGRRPPRRSVLSHSVLLYASTFLAMMFKFLGGFVVAGMLGPTLYGLRNAFGLVTEYQQFSHAGTLDAMRKEVPYYRGSNDAGKADDVMANVFGANMAYAAFALVVVFGLAIYFHLSGYEPVYVDFALFLGGFIVFEKIRMFFDARLLVDKRSDSLGKARLLHQFLGAAACVVLVYYYELRGLFIGLLIAEAVTAAYVVYLVRWVPAVRISARVVWSLLRVGLPIMLTALAFVLLRSVDRVVIAAQLPHELLGYFSVATIVSGLMPMVLADVVGAIMFPRIMEEVGRRGDVRIKDYVVQPTLLIAYLTPFALGAIALTIHLPLTYVLPEYAPAIPVTRLLLLSSFCLSVPLISLLACIALNRQVSVLLLTLGSVAVNALLSYALISHGFGIEGVAVGTVIAHFLFGVLVMSYALRRLRSSFGEICRIAGAVYLPAVYAAILLALLMAFTIGSTATISNALLASAVDVIAFSVLFSLSLLFVRKQPIFLAVARYLPFGKRLARAGLH